MAIDSKQKRMSAINHACPWRGPLVDALEAGFSIGNRQAADYFYSGIESDAPILGATPEEQLLLMGRKFRGVGRGMYRGIQ